MADTSPAVVVAQPVVIVTEPRRAPAAVVATGPQGPAGASSASYEHTQATPASIWNINHLLGFRPNISAYNVGSRMVMGEVHHISLNQAEVIFDMPVAGFAICS